MTMLTAQGFKRKRFDDYLQDMQTKARELWGADINLSDRSNLGKFIKLIAGERAKDAEEMEAIYNNDFYDSAEDVNLDKLAKRIGLTRLLEKYAEGTVEFTVDPNVAISAGVIVATTDGIEFITTTGGVETGGKITVEIKALSPGGARNVPANTITVIKTPIAGVRAVTNPEATDGGRDRETDAEFRLRYEKSVARGGSGTIPSLLAALLELPGVKDANITENDTDEVVNGQPKHSIAPMVYGGSDAEIAQTIFEVKGGGVRSWGSTTINVTDSKGRIHPIGFSRPTVVNVWVRLTLTKNANYPVGGDALVKTEVIKYIGGADADNTIYDGGGLGADVIRYKISGAITNIPGIDDVLVELSTDGAAWNQSNVSINATSVAYTDSAKVVIV